jgi:hypothetical protein
VNLLKNDGTTPEKLHKIYVINWPDNKQISKYGWYFGIGFGLAMTVAIPLILILFSCIVGIGLSILGNSLGALF